MEVLKTLISECEERISILKEDKYISEDNRKELIRENNRFLCRLQELYLLYRVGTDINGEKLCKDCGYAESARGEYKKIRACESHKSERNGSEREMIIY
ncbi:MAG: hypothetical protein GY928_02050 [Colwellia sp.]|nr:hypothetical protein [Colwellia sp.]